MMNELYPFSTQDGSAIPLDIIKSKGLFIKQFTSASVSSFSLPIGTEVAILTADISCIVSAENNLADLASDNLLLNSAILVVGNSLVTTKLAENSTLYIRGLTASGKLYVQLIEKWAGLALEKQLTRK